LRRALQVVIAQLEMKMAKIDLDALKRKVMSISATRATRKRPRATPTWPSEELKSLSIQRRDEARRLVGEMLAKAGVNVAGLQEKISKDNRAFRDAAKGLQKPRSETLAKRRIAFQNNIAHRRAALEPFGNLVTTTTSMTYLPEPLFITVSPNSSSGFLQGTNIAPYDNRAQIASSTNRGASVYCDFWFSWLNDSNVQVVVTNASSQTVLNGSVYATIDGSLSGLFGHYEAFKFSSGAEITLYQGDTVAVSVDIQDETFDLRTHLDLNVNHSLDFEYETLTPSTSGWPIIVPAGTGILIQVAPYLSWDFYSGWGWYEGEDEGSSGNVFIFDFANNEADYFMQCSGVALEIQTPLESEPVA
jgi:hypothetical protein